MSLVDKRLFSDIQDLETTQKCALINAFWPHLSISESDYFEDEYAALFAYWGDTLRSLRPFGHEFATEEWDGILAILTQLSFGRDIRREALVSELRKNYQNTSDKAIACSVELAVRLWIGINVRSKGLFVGPEKSKVSYIRWQNDQSLKETVAAPFMNNRKKARSAPIFLFDDSFTAVGLKDICRLEILWTDNLADHLRLHGSRGERQLSVYKHKICLINHRKEPEPMLIPKDLLDETICTLDLLFPEGDEPTETFLNDEKVQMWIENSIDIPQAIEVDDFEFWRSRLSQLLSLFYGPPETVRQTLLDRRNTAQFATIWVAIFGVFFLTILFGVLSTVYSAKQYSVAVDSYKFAIAQACQQTSQPLPGYCT
ncbi:unnamed protein product [Alternaria sp. RS040]